MRLGRPCQRGLSSSGPVVRARRDHLQVGASRHSARICFTVSTSPSSIPSRRDSRRSRASSRSSHISRDGLAHFSQTPRRSRRQKNVHRPAKRSALHEPALAGVRVGVVPLDFHCIRLVRSARTSLCDSLYAHGCAVLTAAAAPEPLQVRRRGHLPVHLLARRRVDEPQLGRVQGQPRGPARRPGSPSRPAAGCRPPRRTPGARPPPGGCGSGASARSRAGRPTSRVAAGTSPATSTCVTARLPVGRLRPAAAAAVAAVADQPGRERLRLHRPGHDGDVPAHDRVRLELPAQVALGPDAPGEDDQPARLLVQPVDDAQPGQVVLASPRAGWRWPPGSRRPASGPARGAASSHCRSAGWRTVLIPDGFSTTTTSSSRCRMTTSSGRSPLTTGAGLASTSTTSPSLRRRAGSMHSDPPTATRRPVARARTWVHDSPGRRARNTAARVWPACTVGNRVGCVGGSGHPAIVAAAQCPTGSPEDHVHHGVPGVVRRRTGLPWPRPRRSATTSRRTGQGPERVVLGRDGVQPDTRTAGSTSTGSSGRSSRGSASASTRSGPRCTRTRPGAKYGCCVPATVRVPSGKTVDSRYP